MKEKNSENSKQDESEELTWEDIGLRKEDYDSLDITPAEFSSKIYSDPMNGLSDYEYVENHRIKKSIECGLYALKDPLPKEDYLLLEKFMVEQYPSGSPECWIDYHPQKTVINNVVRGQLAKIFIAIAQKWDEKDYSVLEHQSLHSELFKAKVKLYSCLTILLIYLAW